MLCMFSRPRCQNSDEEKGKTEGAECEGQKQPRKINTLRKKCHENNKV